MKKQFEKALKEFGKKNNCKLKILDFQKGYASEENHYPFDSFESRSSLRESLDGKMYLRNSMTAYVMTSDFKVSCVGNYSRKKSTAEFSFWTKFDDFKSCTTLIEDKLSDQSNH